MGNTALYLLLRAAAAFLPRIPVRVAYALADVAGSLSYYLLPVARAAMEENLAIAFPDRSRGELRGIAHAAFRHDARNWVDTLRIPTVTAAELRELVRVEGWEHLEAAVAGGKGVILVTMHLGNFDLVGQLIAARGWQLTVPVERIEPPELYELLTRRRESKGIHLYPVEEAPRAMLRALARGEIVGATVDRYVSGKHLDMQFFGHEAALARGPASLARHSGAPVLVGIAVRRDHGGFDGFVSPPLPAAPAGDPVTSERAILQGLVAIMEEFIARYPEQWLAFTPIWGNTAGKSPATIEQQTEAAV